MENSQKTVKVRECDSRGCRQRTGVMSTSFGEFCPRCLESLYKVIMLLKTSGPEGGYWQVQVRKTQKTQKTQKTHENLSQSEKPE